MADKIDEVQVLLEKPVQEMGLNTCATNILLRAGCKTFRDVVRVDFETLYLQRWCGPATLYKIYAKLQECGFASDVKKEFVERVARDPNGTKRRIRKRCEH